MKCVIHSICSATVRVVFSSSKPRRQSSSSSRSFSRRERKGEMESILLSEPLFALPSPFFSSSSSLSVRPSLPLLCGRRPSAAPSPCQRRPLLRLAGGRAVDHPATSRNGAFTTHSVQSNGVYTVGDFMTKKEELHVVKTTTSVDEALEMLVEYRITGFPVIDDDWNLVGVVSDYDLLALDSISGSGLADNSMFPEVDSTWKTFNEIQKMLSKNNGKIVGEVMTPSPLVVRETTNLEDAARLLLETKYRRLPVVDSSGKLVGIITRGNVVRAALQIKRANEKRA